MSEINSKHILQLSREEKLKFINSFDFILTDCDAVLWYVFKEIPRITETVQLLKQNGKEIKYISNNSFRQMEGYKRMFTSIGVDIKEQDLVHPAVSVVRYLKEIKFKGVIYCIASAPFKKYLTNAGYDIIDGPNEMIEENFRVLISTIHDKKSVQAVIIDVDFNLCFTKLARAQLYLKYNPDCILIRGATDKNLPITPDFQFMGPGYFGDILEEVSGREAIVLSKPGKALSELIIKQFKIQTPSRCLFIGDMLAQDMAFGTQCGFQKLLVLTGGTTKESLFSGQVKIEEIPDYYADSLADFIELFDELKELN